MARTVEQSGDAVQTILITSGRNPYEATISVGVLSVIGYSIINETPSRVVQQTLPSVPVQSLWAFACAVGALITLLGLWMGRPGRKITADPLDSLRVEAVGQFALGVGVGIYALLLWEGSDWERSGIVITIAASIAAGALIRTGSVVWGLRKVAKGRSR